MQLRSATRQVAITVTPPGAGPQLASILGETLNRIFAGLLTDARNVTDIVFGAHLTNSPMLPELPTPSELEKLILAGLADHMAFGAVRDEKPTAAYPPTIIIDNKIPSISKGK